MKVFISADIEGITTTTQWPDTDAGSLTYKEHTLQMTKEVNAACEGAILAGAKEIFVKDAHDSAMNIDQTALPECVKIHRRWSGDPYSMVEGIDESFDAAMFIGYHNAASIGNNPLSHTMNNRNVYVKLNEVLASEFMFFSYAAAYRKVPTVFLSGDKGLCEEAMKMNPNHPNLITLPVKEGIGYSTINYSPNLMVKMIKEKTKEALSLDFKGKLLKLPNHFKLEVCYKEHGYAHKVSFYPNAKKINDTTVVFENNDYYEILRALKFIL